MGFRSVFNSLREIFPQIDQRVLKAVAIEHNTDVDSAVDFILSEFLLTLDAQQKEPLASTDSSINFTPPDSGQLMDSTHGIICDGISSHEALDSVSSKEIVLEKAGNNFPIEQQTEMVEEDSPHKYSNVLTESDEIIPLFNSTGESASREVEDHIQLKHTELKSHLVLSDLIDSTHGIICDGISSPEASLSVSLNEITPEKVGDNSPIEQCTEIVEEDIPLLESTGELASSEVEDHIQLKHDDLKSDLVSSSIKYSMECEDPSDPASLLATNDSENVPECSNFSFKLPYIANLDSAFTTLKVAEGESSCYVREENINCPRNTGDAPSTSNEEDTEECHAATEINAQSSQIVNVDHLEELITDCKGIKGVIASEVEAIIDLAREADIREDEARLAKEEASKDNFDIIAQTKDLKEMLKHADEANKMHAGEIYGEKSILAAEAKELQSRLLSLTEQRHSTLTITEEIQRTLKSRIDAAEKEILEVTRDKEQKEEESRKDLKEQETIMAMVVLESKRLQEEAEENSKLRDFLVERGRLVDTLQGEISVICEDVLKLKERIDQGLPLGRSLQSSQVFPGISSSTCSSTSSSASERLYSAQKPLTSSISALIHGRRNTASSDDQRKPVPDADHDIDDDWFEVDR